MLTNALIGWLLCSENADGLEFLDYDLPTIDGRSKQPVDGDHGSAFAHAVPFRVREVDAQLIILKTTDLTADHVGEITATSPSATRRWIHCFTPQN